MTIKVDAKALAGTAGAVAAANIKATEATISAAITRADGTVEHVGVISYWHVNPLKRWWFNAKRFFSKR